MEWIWISLAIVLSIINIVFLAIVIKRHGGSVSNEGIVAVQTIADDNKKELETVRRLISENNNGQIGMLKIYQDTMTRHMTDLIGMTDKNMGNVAEKLKELSQIIGDNLKLLQQNNEKKLEEMRVTVGEKLDATLNERLNQNVQIISKQLDSFISGISEVKSLSSGVDDLKNILGNIKNRGTFGEVQLGALLQQILAPSQFAEQVDINHNGERVDFVIYLPGKDGKTILLPIDAKFPMEDYKKLQDSIDAGDKEQIDKYRNQLISVVKKEAKKIKEKYISIPDTTDFAIMYLPTESLYAEVIKEAGVFESLQRDLRITVCGPTTISALLNSLQMGFKTLAIEKKSSEIWELLSQFKKDFGIYIELLNKTQKKLSEASNDIEDATHRSELIRKRLNKMDDIGDGEPVIALKEVGSGENE